jgi:hypothetical protein
MRGTSTDSLFNVLFAFFFLLSVLPACLPACLPAGLHVGVNPAAACVCATDSMTRQVLDAKSIKSDTRPSRAGNCFSSVLWSTFQSENHSKFPSDRLRCGPTRFDANAAWVDLNTKLELIFPIHSTTHRMSSISHFKRWSMSLTLRSFCSGVRAEGDGRATGELFQPVNSDSKSFDMCLCSLTGSAILYFAPEKIQRNEG